jgi:subtilase family serine protease
VRLGAILVAVLLLAATAAWAAKPLPDLIVQSAGVPTNAVGGTTILVRDTVLNKGKAPAKASATAYYLSIDGTKDAKDIPLVGSRAVPKLRPGAKSIGHAKVVMPTNVTGLFEVLACADGKSRVREVKETNNCTAARKPIQINLPPPTPTTTP